MARCDCTVKFGNGLTQRCAAEATQPSGKCYLHDKYFAGLCSPTEFDPDVSIPVEDRVVAVRDSGGKSIVFSR